MEEFFIYFIKSSGLLFVFWICFRLFLKRETFFQHHRFYLLFGVFTSLLLPLWVLKKVIFVVPEPKNNPNFQLAITTNVAEVTGLNWYLIVLIIYIIGVIILSFRFAIQFYSLNKLLSKCTITNDNRYRIAITNETISPFSFFNTIVYNPKMYDQNALEAILVHEKIHANQIHSIDSILSNILCIIQWANPIVWWYKKDMEQNLEYIADKNSIASLVDKKAYQYLLLHQSGQYQPETTIINPFFNSLIKKRIVMLNQQKSKKINLMKFSLILPLLVSFLVFFNTKTIAQTNTEKNTWSVGYGVAVNKLEISVDPNSTDAELEAQIKNIKEKTNIDLNFAKIKRNSKGEIVAIKSTYKTNDGQSGNYNISSDEPITAFVFFITMNNDGKIETTGYGPKSNNDNVVSTASTIQSKNGEKPLIIIDDEQQGASFDLNSINADDVSTMNVFTDKSATDKYGDKAKNGVVEITMKKNMEIKSSGKEPLYVVDGKIVETISDIDPEVIKEVNVLKDKSAMEKYGDKGKNGVVEITMKKNIEIKSSGKEPLYIVDGKIVESISNIDPDNIKEINVLKDKSAVAKYGDKGKNGVVEVILKKE